MGGGLRESFALVFSGLTDFSFSFTFSSSFFSSSFFSSFSFLTSFSLSLSLFFSFFSLPVVSARGEPERERDDRELKLAEREREETDAERDRRRGEGDRRGFRRGERERDLETTFHKAVLVTIVRSITLLKTTPTSQKVTKVLILIILTGKIAFCQNLTIL